MNKTKMILIPLVAGGLMQGTLLTGSAAADDASPAQKKPIVAKKMAPLQPPVWFSNDKAAEALLKAAYDGDLEKLRAALQQGTPVNVKSERDFTPLDLAAMENHLEALKILIAAGAKVDTDHWDGTCLYWNSMGTHTEVVKMLIDAGADVNARQTEYGWTPLIAAAKEGRTENVKLLLAAKADVNAAEDRKWNRTALYFAASQKNPELMSVLLKAGADPSIADKDGMTPLMLAARAGLTENVKLLIDAKADLNVTRRWSDGWRPALVFALHDRNWESAEALLDAGANAKWASMADGMSSLMFAVSTSVKGGNDANAQLRVVQKMIKAGADVNAQSRYNGATALHIVADTGDEAIAKLLIDAGANVNAKDNKGRTPLSVARSDKPSGYCWWGDGDGNEGMCRPPRDKPRSDKVKELLEKAGAR